LPQLHVHPALIEQAIFNVLENAAKFSPDDVPIEGRPMIMAPPIFYSVKVLKSRFGNVCSQTILPINF